MPCVFYLLVSGMCDWSQVFGDLKFTARNCHTTGKTASLLYSLIQTQSNLILLNSFELNDNASPGIFLRRSEKFLSQETFTSQFKNHQESRSIFSVSIVVH